MAGETQKITMGAGKWYVASWEGGAIDFDTLCVEDNLMGYTQGGAQVTFTPETYTIEDDIGMVRKTFQTKATSEMKTGLLTFTVKSLAALMSTGAISEKAASTSEKGLVTLKLSGGKTALKRLCVAFVYEDDETGLKTYVGMVATNIAPLFQRIGGGRQRDRRLWQRGGGAESDPRSAHGRADSGNHRSGGRGDPRAGDALQQRNHR